MTRVLIDADPGTDDALAIMMALSSPDLDVLGITTVGGNATLADTTRNALRVLEHLGAGDLSVSRGAARPLRGRFHYGYYFHGAAGLGVRLASPRLAPRPEPAWDFIARTARRHRGDLVVVALGPLTNLATALAGEPRLTSWIKEIVVMGGAVEVEGNVTAHAEFNIYNDPEAADAVLSSGVPVTLVGLDVCGKTYVGRDDLPWVPGDSAMATLSNRLLGGWFASDPERDRFHLCDPLALVAAVRPDLLRYRTAAVTVETGDPQRRGETVARYGGGQIRVAVGVDVDRAKGLLVELLRA